MKSLTEGFPTNVDKIRRAMSDRLDVGLVSIPNSYGSHQMNVILLAISRGLDVSEYNKPYLYSGVKMRKLAGI